MKILLKVYLFKFWINKLNLVFIFVLINIIFSTVTEISGQSFYITGSLILREVQLDNELCSGGCSIEYIGLCGGFAGLSFGPDGNLYGLGSDVFGNYVIYQVDISSGNSTAIFTTTLVLPKMFGFLSVGGGIFYSHQWSNDQSDLIYRWDTNSGTITSIGGTGFILYGEIAMQGGIIYSFTADVPNTWTIIQIDILNPANSVELVTLPYLEYLVGLTASPYCKTLLGTNLFTHELVLVSLIDGAVTPVCDLGPVNAHLVATALEHAPEPACIIALDLDCDDSSGATNADYNSPDYDCLSNGVGVADEDIKMLYDAIISEMTIQITGFVPDAPFEILSMTGSIAGINVSGSGTDMITFSNVGGAKSTDFKDALRLVVYNNISNYPTGGLRTVVVQFTTESGAMSNVATAFIQVNELQRVPVDLGPDQLQCDGETTIFDAGNPSASYNWSTGQHSQTITTGMSGQYIVTVSNGILCPNQDTVELDIIPVIHIALTGETDICDNEQANMIIENDAPFPMTIEITPDPGSSFTLTDVEGNYTFFDLPGGLTVYTITSIVPSQPACIEMTDSTQVIFVYPTYVTNVAESICDGDSIWLGYYWEDQAGQYEILFYSIDGCDSTVNFTIGVSPAVNISAQATTCIPAEAGVFITHLNNANGCDTVVSTTVTLLSADTTSISLNTCNSSATGIFFDTLTNIQGCDSFIITTITLMPPQDTTRLFQTTCDSSLLGVFQQLLTNQSGCDSLVITTIDFAMSDTVLVNTSSCDPTQIGVFMQSLIGQDGCDSIVFTTVTAGIPDTTYTSATTCDSASLGVVETHFSNLLGCDSTVFTTVSYSVQDSVFIFSTTCDPSEVSLQVSQYTNQFGCDSIVTETVSLLLSDQTFLNSTTCDSLQAGVFIYNLINLNGCDSLVTETITALPHDHTFLLSFTCDPNAVSILTTHYSNLFGCDSAVTSTVSLLPADTTFLSFKTCDPSEVSILTSHYSNQNGCDSVVIQETTLYNLPSLIISSTSDYNGFDISCFGESDGSVNANIAGTSPFDFIWSTGSKDQSLTELPAGSYGVTVTDANGCIASDEITLVQSEQFMIGFTITGPDCFDQHNGGIIADQTGGVEPVRYSIDGVNFQPSPTFNNLSGGTYTVTAFDANNCEVKEIIGINVPLMVNVELGDNQVIMVGDTVILNAIINVPFDSLASITWIGLNNSACPTCLTQPVVPIITTTYSVTVTTEDGCSDEDALTIFLEKNTDIYVPNIFSPNGDNINDKLIISAGTDVEEISSFIIFDRWGNMVFSQDHFQANDPTYAWDGRLNGRPFNTAVFAYKLIAKFKDGSQFIKTGDVTLLR